MNQLWLCVSQIDVMPLVLIFAVVWGGWLMWNLNRGVNRFLFVDMLLDGNGKASMARFGQLGAFLLSSWLLVYVTLHEHYSESAFGLYMAAWAGAGVLNKFAEKKNADTPSQ